MSTWLGPMCGAGRSITATVPRRSITLRTICFTYKPLSSALGERIPNAATEVAAKSNRCERGPRRITYDCRVPREPYVGRADTGSKMQRLETRIQADATDFQWAEEICIAVMQRFLARHLPDSGCIREVPPIRYGHNDMTTPLRRPGHLVHGLLARIGCRQVIESRHRNRDVKCLRFEGEFAGISILKREPGGQVGVKLTFHDTFGHLERFRADVHSRPMLHLARVVELVHRKGASDVQHVLARHANLLHQCVVAAH